MESMKKEKILQELITILQDMTSDWDLDYSGGISESTKLIGDLAFESIEIVQLMVTIEQHFDLKNLISERLLMRDGRYVSELTVSEIVNFIREELKANVSDTANRT